MQYNVLSPEGSGGLVFYENEFFGARSGAGPHSLALAYEEAGLCAN